MKKMAFMLAAAVLMLSVAARAEEKTADDNLKVMSYNIRLGSANDGTNSWHMRYAATAEMIEDQKPDVFGVQEALDYQINFIQENLLLMVVLL